MDSTEGITPESHFSGVVVVKLSGDMVSILAFTYTMANRPAQMRVPGGSGRSGETPKETALREFQEEAVEKTAPFKLPEECLLELFRKTVSGHPDQGGGVHHKIFYVVPADELVCTLRRKRIPDRDGVMLGMPAWHEAESLVREMLCDRTPRYHVLAVLKLVKTIASGNTDVARRYAGLLADHREFMNRN